MLILDGFGREGNFGPLQDGMLNPQQSSSTLFNALLEMMLKLPKIYNERNCLFHTFSTGFW